MPISTRSQHNKSNDTIQKESHIQNIQEEGESSNPIFSINQNPIFNNNMDNREENPFPQVDSDEEQEEERLREAKQDPKFHKAIEKILQ